MLGLEKAEKSEIKLPMLIGSWKKDRYSRKKHVLLLHNYAKSFDVLVHNKLWKNFKEVGIPEYLTCLLRNLYAGQKATVRTRHGTMDWFQWERLYTSKAIYCHPAYLTYMKSTSGKMLGRIKLKPESRLL